MAQKISNQDVRKILDGDPILLVNEAERFGKELARTKLSKSQMRNAYGTVRRIEATWQADGDQKLIRDQLRNVLLLKPRLAYQAKRKDEVRPLADVLSDAIDYIAADRSVVVQSDRFQRFVELFEAIIAYHTSYGGKN